MECIVEIKIEQTLDFSKYPPDGVKCIFRFLRGMATTDNKYELMFLIDNHAPFGFHMHDRLPKIHDSRISIQAKNWREAWMIFDKFTKELMDET